MQFGLVFLRVTLAFTALDMGLSTAPTRKRSVKLGKYPLELHQLFREQLAKKKPTGTGIWSAWTPWTPCSRTCGGGITQQTRHCVSRSADSRFGRGQRRRRQNKNPKNGCIGLYKRIHMCNTQECPGGLDFRVEQCAAFNNRPFKGKIYIWEPFLHAAEECALNCRAVGMDFFATLNRTVADGTSCNHPRTSQGRPAPRGTKGVCVDGYCKSIGANGIVGSIFDDAAEECSACNKGTCKSFNGLYTRSDLPPGYSVITQIPRGACRILVQQLKHTKNFIAIRDANGTFILNGDWKFSHSRNVEGAGTKFVYFKQDGTTPETVSAAGPLANPVDIMIVFNQPNLGIKYGYSVPGDQPVEQIAPPFMKRPTNDSKTLEPRKVDIPLVTLNQRDEPPRAPPHRRYRRRKFAWKITGVTACSKSCAGGLQTTVVTCVREYTQGAVNERRCSHLDRPQPQAIKCNVQDCPPRWGGFWAPCAGSCGQGVQRYVPQCEQDLNGGRVAVVNEGGCPSPKPEESSRACTLPGCEGVSDNELHREADLGLKNGEREWTTGPWSQCSVSCGTGHRSRSVTCPSAQCKPEVRPSYTEFCENSPCTASSSSPALDPSSWLLTDWSQCSSDCGTGTQTRLAVCTEPTDCPNKPETSRACSSDRMCSGRWFTGPWGSCSNSCASPAAQTRDVYCIVRVRGQARITNEMTCPAHEKPATEQPCAGACPAQWFMGEWGECENCPTGAQRREVKCMDAQGGASGGCAEDGKPAGKRICGCEREVKNTPVQDEPVDRNCVDRIRNCYLAVQARLCQYPYYTSHCCVSCKRAQQDLLE